MTHLRNFFRFWYDFIIGDDWMTAAGVVIALVVTAVIAHQVASAWWVMPVTVALLLAISAWQETRRSK